MRDLEFVTEVTEPGGAGEVVSRPATRTPHPTRAGGQDDGSYTNSLKLEKLEKHTHQAIDATRQIGYT